MSQNFLTFCQFSFEGGGEGAGSKTKLRELSFLSDIDILTSMDLTLNIKTFATSHKITQA